MKPCSVLLLTAAFCLLPCAAAFPASPEAQAIGVDIGTTAASAVMGAAAASLSIDLPLSRSWSVDLEPSGYWSQGTDAAVLQFSLAGLVRFYLLSLFEPDTDRPVQWGPFLAAGAIAAWEHVQAVTTIDDLAIGAEFRAGYRLVFGDKGIFVEPSLGWTAFLGSRFAANAYSSSLSSGMTAAVILGYRF